MSVRAINPMPPHTIKLVFDNIRVPFQPKRDPGRKLAEEIESCKRKIWECVDPADRQRYLEKKQKKDMYGQVVLGNKENSLGCTTTKDETIGEVHREPAKLPPIQMTKSNRSNLEFQVNAMKVADLKKELRELGFDTGGLKKDLRFRLLQAKLKAVDSSAVRTLPVVPQEKDAEMFHLEAKHCTNGSTLVDRPESDDNDCKDEDAVNVNSLTGNGMLVSDVILPKSQKDSFSSMQVEHHVTEIIEGNHPAGPVQGSDSWKEHAWLQSKTESKSPFQKADLQSSKAATTLVLIQDASSIGQEARVSEEMPPADPIVSAKPQLEPTEAIFSIPVRAINEDDPNIARPVSEASSSTSKSSGKMVKDMVSKFSGLGSISSSSSNGSALSKGLQAKKEARLARMAEIREKSKPVTSTKPALISKEYTSTLSSLTAAAATTASTKKNTLATQMREKAAATAAMSLKKGSATTTSKPVFSSAVKRHLPMKAISQVDSLGATMKQQSSILKSIKDVQSPIDTYEISDREDSGTDDSDSEVDSDKQKKKIPVWASRVHLLPALEQQYHGCIDGRRVDPDTIFPEVQTCDLEAIFGSKKAKYRSRTSSGNWAQDKVTAAEKLVYKRDMGFATDVEVSEI